MSVLANNEHNSIDEAITVMRKSIPEQVRSATALYFKYGKLLSEKIESLKGSNEKYRIRGLRNFDSINSLTFDKLIFLFDKDLYIDFINEISRIPNQDCWSLKSYENCNENEGTWNRNSTFFNDNIPISLGEMKFRYLMHPFTGIEKITNPWNFNKCMIPMIKVTPTVLLDQIKTVPSRYEAEGVGIWNLFKKELAPYGIGASDGITLDVSIDIESLFETIINMVKKVAKNISHDIKDFKDLDEKQIANISESVTNELSPRIFYSMATTFLATVAKLYNTRMDFFADLGNDILNSCRTTMWDGFDSNGDEAGISEGSTLRNMAINVRDVIDAALISNHNDRTRSNKHFILINDLIKYLFGLKYETVNYIKIPALNLKHKNLTSIGRLAKTQTGFLRQENILELQLAYTHSNKLMNNDGLDPLAALFIPLSVAKVEGTFAVTKRMYDLGKDFLDTFSKFIIIKKRMADTAAFNYKDGTTIDKIGKNYGDYRNYLTNTYKEVKQKLNTLTERVNSLIKGRKNLTLINNSVGENDSQIKGINTIIYGITAETIPGMCVDYYGNRTDAVIDSSILENDKMDKWNKFSQGETIDDINKIWKYLNETRESKYISNSRISSEFADVKYAPLVTSWLKYNQILGKDIIDLPYRNIKINLTILLHDSMNYAVNSISEMSPNVDALDPSNLNARYYDLDVKTVQDYPRIRVEKVTGGQEPEGVMKDIYSSEELRERFEEWKQSFEDVDENSDEDLFGLFNDFMGVPVGRDITASELRAENEVEQNPTILANESFVEERQKLIELRKEYDEFIMSKL